MCLTGKVKHSHTLPVWEWLSPAGQGFIPGNAPLAVPELLGGHIQRVLNKTHSSWKEITLQLKLGAPHTLTASEGAFWKRGVEGEIGEYSNKCYSSLGWHLALQSLWISLWSH